MYSNSATCLDGGFGIRPSQTARIGELLDGLGPRSAFDWPGRPEVRCVMVRGRAGGTVAHGNVQKRGAGAAEALALVGELRIDVVAVEMEIPGLGVAIEICEVAVTESGTASPSRSLNPESKLFTIGYGLILERMERKAISMLLVGRALRWEEHGDDVVGAPAQDLEFVLSHGDTIQATGFPKHIKPMQYIDFQSEPDSIRRLSREARADPVAEAAE